MKLYQNPDGDVTTAKEIGDTDDGWQINTGTPVPKDAMVEVVYRDGDREEPTPAHDFDWGFNLGSATVMAYRIIKPKLQLSLEIGGIYRDRSGKIHGPLVARTDHPSYPFKGAGSRSWTADGYFYVDVSDDPRDLVEHIATAPGEGWIAHNKNGIPSLPVDSVVEVVTRSGKVQLGGRPAHDWSWAGTGSTAPILAYRIVPPTFKLEIGGIYRDREGTTHGPLRAVNNSIYLFGSDYHTWTTSGTLYSHVEDPHDLITHIATVPGEGWIAWNEPHCPFQYENPELEVVTRAGTINVGDKRRPAKDWYWGPTVVLIVAYRVVRPTPKLQLTLEERVARLEEHLA